METLELRNFLAANLGLDADCVGPDYFKLLIQRISAETVENDLASILEAAASRGQVWHTLVDHAVVPETWFFRDETPFDHVVNIIEQRRRATTSSPIRILSCPCSTGEEPYSLAIALAEAGVPPTYVSIDAADVSASAIRSAQEGIFRARSFRGRKQFDRLRYFSHAGDSLTWRIRSAIRDMVQFRLANMVSCEGLETLEPYDIVLCRNLLIYLHTLARSSVMNNLGKLLKENGVLIVGHAETAIAREYGFVGDGTPSAFAFIKSLPRNSHKASIGQAKQSPSQKNPARLQKGNVERPIDKPVAEAAAVWSKDRLVPTLMQIRQFGDQGRLKEAEQACQLYLDRVPESAEGYFLLGVIQASAGNVRAAERALRKALYLQPQNTSAMLHLALVYESDGDTDRAAVLRKRAANTPNTVGRE